MGKVGKFIVGAVLIGASFAISGPGIWAAGTQILKSVLLSAGVGLASAAAISSAVRSKQGSITTNTADPSASLPVVYGSAKLGLRLMDIRTSGTNNVDLYIVGALCHGSSDGTGIEGIDEIFFDDRLAMAQTGVIQPPFLGKLVISRHYGADFDVVDPLLNVPFPVAWPVSSKGIGVAYVVFKLTYDPEVYPTGIPNITCIVRGSRVNDLRNAFTINAIANTTPIGITTTSPHGYSTGNRVTIYENGATAQGLGTPVLGVYQITVTGASTFTLQGTSAVGVGYNANSCNCVRALWSTNPIAQLTDYLTSPMYGLKAWYTELDQASLQTSATYSDNSILKFGATSNQRFTSNGWLDVGQSNQENIRQLMTGCRGNLIYEGGKYRVFIRQAQTPTAFTLTEANIIGGWSFTAPGVQQSPNIIRGSFIVPGLSTEGYPFQPETKIWPLPGDANGFLTADNNYEVVQDIDLPFTTDPYTALQIMMVALREGRSSIGVSLTANESALQLQVGDVVPITHPTPGWVAQPFWVLGIFLQPDATVRLVLGQYDVNAYSLDALSTIPSPPTTVLPNPFTCIAPTDLILVAGDDEAKPDRDGSHRPYIRATWTVDYDPYLLRYDVQYRQSGKESWLTVADANRVDTEALVGPVSEGTSYDVRVRAVNNMGVPSEWIDDAIVPHLPTLQRSGSKLIDDMSGQTPGGRWVPVGTFAGTFVDVYDPDAKVGGKVGRATGPVWYEYAYPIPYDPNLLYNMQWRIRQLRAATGGGPGTINLGLMCLTQDPTQPGVFTRNNMFGLDTIDNQHWVAARGLTLTPSREWTNRYAHVKGFAGGKVTLASSMLSHSGLGSFSAANLCDGNTDPASVGFSVDAASAGAYLKADFGVGNEKSIVGYGLHMSAAGSVAAFDLEFSDDGSTWTKAT